MFTVNLFRRYEQEMGRMIAAVMPRTVEAEARIPVEVFVQPQPEVLRASVGSRLVARSSCGFNATVVVGMFGGGR